MLVFCNCYESKPKSALEKNSGKNITPKSYFSRNILCEKRVGPQGYWRLWHTILPIYVFGGNGGQKMMSICSDLLTWDEMGWNHVHKGKEFSFDMGKSTFVETN
jgi:hypothetical protein